MRVNHYSLKPIIVAVVFALLVSIGATSVEAVAKDSNIVVYKTDFSFVIDGETYRTAEGTSAFIHNNRTYVPLRFASYMLEQYVDWNQTTATVSVTTPTASQLKQLKSIKEGFKVAESRKAQRDLNLKAERIYVYEDVANYNFFGEKKVVPQDMTTFMHKGTIYVPIRFFTEVSSQDIYYNSATKQILMGKDATEFIANLKNSNTNGETNSGNESNNNTEGSEQSPGDNASPIPGEVEPAPGGVDPIIPAPGEVIPTREEIVNGAYKQLSTLRSNMKASGIALAGKYSKATDPEEKASYIEQGKALKNTADSRVEAIISDMKAQLEKYGYDIGNEAEEYYQEYQDELAALLAQYI